MCRIEHIEEIFHLQSSFSIVKSNGNQGKKCRNFINTHQCQNNTAGKRRNHFSFAEQIHYGNGQDAHSGIICTQEIRCKHGCPQGCHICAHSPCPVTPLRMTVRSIDNRHDNDKSNIHCRQQYHSLFLSSQQICKAYAKLRKKTSQQIAK